MDSLTPRVPASPTQRPVMDLVQGLERLVSYFSTMEEAARGDCVYNRLTAIGQPLAASNLRMVGEGLRALWSAGLIDGTRFFCDAGSGDGRVVALAAACFGIPSLGVEYDHRLVAIGQGHLDRLRAMGVFGQVPVYIIGGDFCGVDAYRRIHFDAIATFYCFESNCYCLAQRISEESPAGTLFVYFTQNSYAHFKGLERIMTVRLEGFPKRPYAIHAFKKKGPLSHKEVFH